MTQQELQHKDLASGRWARMSLMEQMANIGSEVHRASVWKKKNNEQYCRKAFERALELIDLTIKNATRKEVLRELTRVREVVCEFFLSESSDEPKMLNKYFYHFAVSLKK